jgi:enoyl-CoA hydratase/carnithine racemase
MDGVVMGGGMGIAQGTAWRIVTERTKMAMPETGIGLFPDVGGGYFLSRCPGHVGEYLALTGEVIGADAALQYGLADVQLAASELAHLWDQLGAQTFVDSAAVSGWLANRFSTCQKPQLASSPDIEAFFDLPDVPAMVQALQAASSNAWAQSTLDWLRKRSPLMLHVVLEQIRRGRGLSLADNLRMERGMVRHCFWLRPGKTSETVEGIRALAVDKDQTPQWNPERIEDVAPDQVAPFFVSPWPVHAHPLRGLD